MNEFTQAIQVLKDLGVIQIFSIPLAFLLFAYLFKKFLLNGSGETFKNIGSFIKELLISYIENEKETIKMQTSIDHKLTELVEKFSDIVESLGDNRRSIEDKFNYVGTGLREHIAETRNLVLLLTHNRETSLKTQGEQKS